METGGNRLECRTCPYEHPIETSIFSRKRFARRERDDVFGGPDAWKNASKTSANCPVAECSGTEAAYFEVQIRSADEPTTQFLRVCFIVVVSFYGQLPWGEGGTVTDQTTQCMTCGNRWREG